MQQSGPCATRAKWILCINHGYVDVEAVCEKSTFRSEIRKLAEGVSRLGTYRTFQ
jgi:hypothetical protein